MKKFSYLLMAAFAVMCVCSSCSKDEDGKIDSNSIVGTWKAVSEEGYSICDGEKEEWNNPYDEDEYFTVTFNANGTGSTVDIYGDETNKDDFTWRLSGNNLGIKFEGETEEVGKVEKLTSTQLVVVYEWVSSDGKEKEYNKTTFTRVK